MTKWIKWTRTRWAWVACGLLWGGLMQAGAQQVLLETLPELDPPVGVGSPSRRTVLDQVAQQNYVGEAGAVRVVAGVAAANTTSLRRWSLRMMALCESVVGPRAR